MPTRPDRVLPLLGLLMPLLLTCRAALAQGAAPPAPAVQVAQVQVRNVAPVFSFVGHVEAIQSVQVVPRVTAFIEREPAPQGSDVKAGDVLFELQKAQYEAGVQAAQAQLASANAALLNAEAEFARANQLNHQGFAAQSQLDQATATRDQDRANVLAAQANLAQAKLNLDYCTITSPIEGRIGVINLTVGNLVTPSTPALATVNQMDPIRVVFSVSDRDFVSVQQRSGTTVQKMAEGLTLQLTLANGATYAQAGRISFIDNQVDPRTGTVGVHADFPNPDRLLVPGGYVTVNVRRAQPEERPLVPVAAVQNEQAGSYVLVVGPDNKVAQKRVELGEQLAQDYIINGGLSGGERVIVEGIQKVHPGDTVNPQSAPSAPAGQG